MTNEKQIPTKEQVSEMSLQGLVDTYNRLNTAYELGGRTINVFKDKASGVKRVEGVLVQIAALGSRADEPAEKPAKKAKAAKAPKAPKEKAAKAPKEKKAKGGGKGRSCKCSGKRLTADHLIENPRREGTMGHKTVQIVIDAGAKGILFEDLIAKGGRKKDVTRNLRKKFFKILAE